MEANGTVIGIVGAARAGATTELIQMADHVVSACKDCLPWVCASARKCSYADAAFESLSGKLLSCSGLVLGTPVYWSDTSGMVRYFFLKMFRVFARSAPLRGLPVFGIGVAGGTGNGLVAGLRPLYHFFQIMQMRALEPVPVTRFNFSAGIEQSGRLGGELARMAGKRAPFADNEERLAWYDALPHVNLSRLGERRLLADLAIASLEKEAGALLATRLVESDRLAAAGQIQAAAAEVTKAYDAAMKVFEGQGTTA
jgi:multimeric flavodoxin WrbA